MCEIAQNMGSQIEGFLLRDATLARYVLSSCARLSVRLSVRHKSVFYQND